MAIRAAAAVPLFYSFADSYEPAKNNVAFEKAIENCFALYYSDR